MLYQSKMQTLWVFSQFTAVSMGYFLTLAQWRRYRTSESNSMVQAAIKPQPGRNFPDFNSGRTAQKVVEAVVEACEVVVGSWP
jgi:hypothetical protein